MDFRDIENQIKIKEAEIQKLRDALDLLKHTFPEKGGASLVETEQGQVAKFPMVGTNDDGKISLSEAVENVITNFKNEFKVTDLIDELKKNGFEDHVNSLSNPKARIGQIVGLLCERGTIIRTVKGRGSSPHWYKAKSLSTANAETLI